MTVIMQPETMDVHNLQNYELNLMMPLLERNHLKTSIKIIIESKTSLKITGRKEDFYNFLYELTHLFDVKLL